MGRTVRGFESPQRIELERRRTKSRVMCLPVDTMACEAEKEKGIIELKNWWRKMMVTHDKSHTFHITSRPEKPALRLWLDVLQEIQDCELCPAG